MPPLQRTLNTVVLALAGLWAVAAGMIEQSRPELDTIRPWFVGGFWFFAAVAFGWAGQVACAALWVVAGAVLVLRRGAFDGARS